MKNKLPSVSIIVPNHNGWERGTLRECLTSLLKLDYSDLEIFLIDNQSTDDSARNVMDWCQKENLDIRVLQNSENNVAKALNLGIKMSKGKYIAVFGDDTVVTPNSLREIIKVMENNKQIGVAMFRLMDYFDRNKIDTVGDSFDFYGNANLTGHGETYTGQYRGVREILVVGGAYVFRKSIIEDIGYFDEMFHVGYEDGDFCIRARLRGYKIVSVSNAVVFHRRGSSYKDSSEESKKVLSYMKLNFYKDQLILLIKNYGLKNLIKSLPVVLCMYLLMSLYQVFFRRKPKDAFLRMKSILWVIYHIDYLLRERHFVQKQMRKLPDTEIIKYMSKNQFIEYQKLMKITNN